MGNSSRIKAVNAANASASSSPLMINWQASPFRVLVPMIASALLAFPPFRRADFAIQSPRKTVAQRFDQTGRTRMHAVGQITYKFNDQSHRLPPEQSIISPKGNERRGQGLGDKTGNYWTIVHTIFLCPPSQFHPVSAHLSCHD
jgi:hypothetical protein